MNTMAGCLYRDRFPGLIQGRIFRPGFHRTLLIGKKFSEGKLQIDISKEFYDGQRIDSKTFEKYLKNATIANLVGKETINLAIKIGLIDPECVIIVKGVPHAQMVQMM